MHTVFICKRERSASGYHLSIGLFDYVSNQVFASLGYFEKKAFMTHDLLFLYLIVVKFDQKGHKRIT